MLNGASSIALLVSGSLVLLAQAGSSSQAFSLVRETIERPKFSEDVAMDRSWKVSHLELREGVQGTWGYLEIQNSSGSTIRLAKFFVDYYDSTGRRCFGLAFSTDSNSESLSDDLRPMKAKDSRMLISFAAAMVPASEVVEARVHWIGWKREDKPERAIAGNSIVRSPATIEGHLPDERPHLALSPLQRSGPPLDLLFARVTIDGQGEVVDSTVLDAASPEVTAWFEQIIHQKQLFRPATKGFANIESAALILIRIARGTSSAPVPARESPWVNAYITAMASEELPPITEWLLMPSSEREQPPGTKSDPETLDLVFGAAGSFWCDEIVMWELPTTLRSWRLRWRR